MWLGIYPRTGENIVMKENGDVVRVRTINRRPEAARFDADTIMAMEALPRAPTPSTRRRNTDIEGELNADGEADTETTAQQKSKASETGPADGGADLGTAPTQAKESAPREFRIDDRLLAKFDYSHGCGGCIHKRDGLPGHRGHTVACRQRVNWNVPRLLSVRSPSTQPSQAGCLA